MFDAFFITLREAAELFLCAEALRACLRERGLSALQPAVLRGGVIGLVAAAALLAGLAALPIDPRLGALATIVFAAAMMFFAVGMLASVHSIRDGIGDALHGWLARACTPAAIAAFMAFVTARETIEVAVFLQDAWQTAGAPDALLGSALGLAASLLLWAAYRSAAEGRSRLFAMFRLSALVLAFVSIDLALGGLRSLALAQIAHDPADATAALLVRSFETRSLHAWLFALLMVMPTLTFLRGWWHEAARS